MIELRKLRLSRKLTLEEVSKVTGISVSQISKMETGNSKMSGKMKRLLLDFFQEDFTVPEIPYSKEQYLRLLERYERLALEHSELAKKYQLIKRIVNE